MPAESFKMSPVDRIFVRMGAKDHIMAGQSTFLTELLETASMLVSLLSFFITGAILTYLDPYIYIQGIKQVMLTYKEMGQFIRSVLECINLLSRFIINFELTL